MNTSNVQRNVVDSTSVNVGESVNPESPRRDDDNTRDDSRMQHVYFEKQLLGVHSSPLFLSMRYLSFRLSIILLLVSLFHLCFAGDFLFSSCCCAPIDTIVFLFLGIISPNVFASNKVRSACRSACCVFCFCFSIYIFLVASIQPHTEKQILSFFG